jgi:hypothetical protein
MSATRYGLTKPYGSPSVEASFGNPFESYRVCNTCLLRMAASGSPEPKARCISLALTAIECLSRSGLK